jgi:hypothetical protein
MLLMVQVQRETRLRRVIELERQQESSRARLDRNVFELILIGDWRFFPLR